jgi:hypothetical protein
MMRKIKVVGLAVVAVLAMSAMTASAANAAEKFTASAAGLTLKGFQTGGGHVQKLAGQ